MDFSACILTPMDEKTARIISEWEYPPPYDVYNFKGRQNGYLFDKAIWGTELFALFSGDDIIGYVACQYANNDLWVGWSFAPELCGNGNGLLFICKCMEEIQRVKQHNGPIFLKVAEWNKRAIKAYTKAGFIYVETVSDEIAYSDK